MAVESNDVKVSAWTLGDRVLLCAFNYDKTKAATAKVALDLRTLGVSLPEGAKAWNLERPDGAVQCKTEGGKAALTFPVGPRDYVLIAVGVRK